MDQLNVQRWASSLRQSPRNLLQNFDYCPLAAAVTCPLTTGIKHSRRTSPRHYSVPTSPELHLTCDELFPSSFRGPALAADDNVARHNTVRNVCASMRIRENKLTNDNRKYSFTLNFSALKKHSDRDYKPRFYTFDMTAKAEDKIHGLSHATFVDSKTSSQLPPAVDQHDLDTVSDAGTYTIDDDVDQVQEVKSKPKLNPSSSTLKRYVNEAKTRHGTFDIHGLIPPATQTVSRPVVDMNIPTRDLPSSSSNSSSMSSIHSLSDESHLHSPSNHFTPPTPPKNPTKPAECFVISPAFQAKSFPTAQPIQPRVEVPWRAKFAMKSVPSKDPIPESNVSSTSARLNQKIPEKQSFSAKTSARPHTAPHDPPSPSSTAFQPVHANPSHQRLISTTPSNDIDEPVSRVSTNRSFLLRQQHSAILPSTSKPVQPPTTSKAPSRPLLKQNTSVSSASTVASNSQTNRAVELRRARAQAKIEELAQRNKKQLLKPENSKTNPASLRSTLHTTAGPKTLPERENLSTTRTISSAAYHRSSSGSPNPPEKKTSVVQRKPTEVNRTDGQQSQRMTTSAYSIGTERCDTLRENGQRLAIRLIQLSSGILEKLNLSDSTMDDDTSVDKLNQLVEKLQTVNETLITIDAALTSSINDDAFI